MRSQDVGRGDPLECSLNRKQSIDFTVSYIRLLNFIWKIRFAYFSSARCACGIVWISVCNSNEKRPLFKANFYGISTICFIRLLLNSIKHSWRSVEMWIWLQFSPTLRYKCVYTWPSRILHTNFEMWIAVDWDRFEYIDTHKSQFKLRLFILIATGALRNK